MRIELSKAAEYFEQEENQRFAWDLSGDPARTAARYVECLLGVSEVYFYQSRVGDRLVLSGLEITSSYLEVDTIRELLEVEIVTPEGKVLVMSGMNGTGQVDYNIESHAINVGFMEKKDA